MFICKECGCEYKIKPDFCDCGNDCFEETADICKKPTASDRWHIPSLLFFIFCIILSILVLLFFPKIKQSEGTTKTKPTNIIKTTNPNIPSLETFWINPKPEVQQPEVVSSVEQIKESINIFKPKPEPIKSVKKPVSTQTVNKPAPKQQTQQQTKPKPQQQTQTVNKTQPTAQQTQQKPTAVQQQNNSTDKYELIRYKNSLRQRLLSNLSFSSVQGTGGCGVEFSIDSSGKLINRAFSFQSDNKSVNDEIYKMLMRTPTFNPPPSSYNGEKIKMIFMIKNDGYEVSFVGN